MNNLDEIKTRLNKIQTALELQNIGDARKELDELISELDIMHLEFFYYPTAAIANYRKSIESRVRGELEKEHQVKQLFDTALIDPRPDHA